MKKRLIAALLCALTAAPLTASGAYSPPPPGTDAAAIQAIAAAAYYDADGRFLRVELTGTTPGNGETPVIPIDGYVPRAARLRVFLTDTYLRPVADAVEYAYR